MKFALKSALICMLLMISTEVQSKPLNVVVSIPPQAEWVKAIGGKNVTVTALLSPGDSPAIVEFSPRKIKEINEADLFVMVGLLPFEIANVKRFGEKLGPKRILRMGIADDHDHHEGHADPHIWMDPIKVMDFVETLTETLVALDPSHKRTYVKNKEVYLGRLKKMHAVLKDLFLPFKGNQFLVYHPTFEKFAERYGLKQLAIEKHGSEPTLKHLHRVLKQSKREHIQTIFVQTQFNRAYAKTVAIELGANIEVVNPLAEDYIQMMQQTSQKIAHSFSEPKRD